MTLAYVQHIFLNPTPCLLSVFWFWRRKSEKKTLPAYHTSFSSPFLPPFYRGRWRIFQVQSYFTYQEEKFPHTHPHLPIPTACASVKPWTPPTWIFTVPPLQIVLWSLHLPYDPCPHCNQSDLSKAANWCPVILLFHSLVTSPLVTGYIQPPYQTIHLSSSALLLQHSMWFQVILLMYVALLSSLFFSPLPGTLLSHSLGSVSGPPKCLRPT